MIVPGLLMGRPETMDQAQVLARDNGYSLATGPKQWITGADPDPKFINVEKGQKGNYI